MNFVSDDIFQEIVIILSVKELARLSIVNRTFDIICRKERSELIVSFDMFKVPIIHMIDPILLIMQFSTYSHSELLTTLQVYEELLKKF